MQIDDIVNKIFTRSFMGYDMREVDAFLDEIIDKLERYESERREMLTAMEYLLDKLERGGELPERRRALPKGEAEPPSEAAPRERPAPRKRARGPRMVRVAGGRGKAEPAAQESRAAEEASGAPGEIALELELLDDAPGTDQLFPEILEALAEMNIPLEEPPAEDEKSVS
ncbi:MAG: DivIVA domain-containing protein [Clostridia bacterium]|nr:DivIVA domain-containing protein [Clostridia bacterium]